MTQPDSSGEEAMVSKAMAVKAGAAFSFQFCHVTGKTRDGRAVQCRTIGKCKVWKTRPDDFQLPVKYGLKECFYINLHNAHEWVPLAIAEAAQSVGLRIDTPVPIIADKVREEHGETAADELVRDFGD